MSASTSDQEFAFVLPLRWPEGDSARRAYESQIVEYARMMNALVEASEGQDSRALVTGLAPFIDELNVLWDAGAVPKDVAMLIQVVRNKRAKLRLPT
jgi:hypothetical protein